MVLTQINVLIYSLVVFLFQFSNRPKCKLFVSTLCFTFYIGKKKLPTYEITVWQGTCKSDDMIEKKNVYQNEEFIFGWNESYVKCLICEQTLQGNFTWWRRKYAEKMSRKFNYLILQTAFEMNWSVWFVIFREPKDISIYLQQN